MRWAVKSVTQIEDVAVCCTAGSIASSPPVYAISFDVLTGLTELKKAQRVRLRGRSGVSALVQLLICSLALSAADEGSTDRTV